MGCGGPGGQHRGFGARQGIVGAPLVNWFDFRDASMLDVVGRLHPATSLDRARAGANALGARLDQAYPQENHARGLTLLPLSQSALNANTRERDLRLAWFLMTMVGLVLALAMHSWIPIVWMAVALLICAVRTQDWLRYQRTPGIHTPLVWARRFTIGILIFGGWWGTTAALLFLSNDQVVKSIAVLSSVAMGAGAICSYSAYPPAAAFP